MQYRLLTFSLQIKKDETAFRVTRSFTEQQHHAKE
jgi:hypothetical protein